MYRFQLYEYIQDFGKVKGFVLKTYYTLLYRVLYKDRINKTIQRIIIQSFKYFFSFFILLSFFSLRRIK